MRRFLAVVFLLVWSGPVMAQGFGVNHRVDDGTSAPTRYLSSLAVTPDGALHCVWADDSPSGGYTSIYYSKSTDEGITWSDPFMLNDRSYPHADRPAIVSDNGGNLYVCFQTGPSPDKIFFTRSTNGGQYWRTPNVRVDDQTYSAKSSPDIDVGPDGTVYVVWSDDRDGGSTDIYCSSSTDGGASWSIPDTRVTDSSEVSYRAYPAVSAGRSGEVFVVWGDDRIDGDVDIYFAASTDGGAAFSDPDRRINPEFAGYQQGPDIAWSYDTLYVAYFNNTGLADADIYLSRSDDGGETWILGEFPVNDQGRYDASWPSISVDYYGNICLAWMDNRVDASFYDIYFARSEDRGETWGEGDIRVNDDGAGNFHHGDPAIDVLPDGRAVVTFFDTREGSLHIYCAAQRLTGVPEQSARPPAPFALRPGYPNPFNSSVTVRFTIPPAESFRDPDFRVYDQRGRYVAALEPSWDAGSGGGVVTWGGRDRSGAPAASGVYFLRAGFGDYHQTARLVLQK